MGKSKGKKQARRSGKKAVAPKSNVGTQSGRMAKLPKIIVGLPSRGIWPVAFQQSLDGALLGNGQIFTANTVYANWHIPDDARNRFVQTGIDQNADYLFFLDTDMIFTKGTLATLLRNTVNIKEDVPFITGGVYCSRSNDTRWHVYDRVERNNWKSKVFPLKSGHHKVDAIGTGCMLIDMNVFKILKRPWFKYEYFERDGKLMRMSEDMVFCQKCQDSGIPMYADSDVIAGHLHSVQIWPTGTGETEIRAINGEVY